MLSSGRRMSQALGRNDVYTPNSAIGSNRKKSTGASDVPEKMPRRTERPSDPDAVFCGKCVLGVYRGTGSHAARTPNKSWMVIPVASPTPTNPVFA
jgi:hypothetical protein